MQRWDALNPYDRVGLSPVVGSAVGVAQPSPGIDRSAGPGLAGGVVPWSPDHPLWWFGAILLVTFGLIAGSSTLRVGPVSASVRAGK